VLATPGSERQKGPIKIGLILSLTGADSSPSREILKGCKLYLDQIKYSRAGRKIELIVENDESRPPTALDKLDKLVLKDHVNVLAGVCLSPVGKAVVPAADKYEMPLVVSLAASDALTQRRHWPWMIRVGFTASGVTHPFGEWVYKTLGYKRVATLGMDYQYGYETVGGFQRTFEESGGRVVKKIWAPPGFTDFLPYLKQVPKDADAVFLNLTGGARSGLVEQYRRAGIDLPIIAVGTSYDEQDLQKTGDTVDGIISILNYSGALNTPANKQFVKAFNKMFDDDAGDFAESGYSTANWIGHAIDAVHGNVEDKQAFMKALRNVNITDAPRGPMRLDDYGNIVQNMYVRKVEKVNGKYQNTVIYTFPNVSQFWKYKPEEYLAAPPYSRDYPPLRN
jgi:branched-chain amino acid transport system substrate-binding protein